jgi:hypothetical protein
MSAGTVGIPVKIQAKTTKLDLGELAQKFDTESVILMLEE